VKRFLALTLFLFFLAALGCSKPETNLIGTWGGKTGSFEFKENKTGLMSPKDNPAVKIPFRWSIQGEDVVAMIFPHPVNKTIFGKLETDSLVVEEDSFKKQK